MRTDPLLLFLAAGLLLAALQAQLDRRVLVVGDELTEALASDFQIREGRAPDSEELRALQEGWVDQELALREARRLRLDEGDPIVRRRLLQKVGLLDEAGAEAAPVQVTSTTRVALEHRFEGAFPHGSSFSLRPQQDYVELFGEDFAEALGSAPVGAWTPIASRYGPHEVRVTERTVASEPKAPLEASARLVARDHAIDGGRQARREGAWVWF